MKVTKTRAAIPALLMQGESKPDQLVLKGGTLMPPGESKPDQVILKGDRLLYFEDLARLKNIKLSEMTLWRMMRDGKFPQNRLVGQRKAWLESEVDDWLATLPTGKGRTPPRKGDQ